MIPFEIPESWTWSPLALICSYIRRGKSPKYSDLKKYPIIAQKCNQWSGMAMDKCQFLDPETIEKYDVESYVKTNDILINSTGLGTLGRIGIFDESLNEYELAVADSHVTIVRTFEEYSKYLYHFLSSPYVQSFIEDLSTGSTKQKELSTTSIGSIIVPIPPKNEVYRIVSRINRLLPLEKEFEQLYLKKTTLSSLFPNDLKKSILQYAIQGKLVPQDSNDEPVTIDCKNPILRRDNSYYEVISGKERCIDEELPFEVPDSWAWCKGNECLISMESAALSGQTFEYIDIDSIDNKNHQIRQSKTIPVDKAPSRAKRKLHSGDVLFSMVRPYLENIALVTDEYKDCIASTGFFVARPSEVLEPAYLFYLLISKYVVDGLNRFMKGDNSPSINKDHVTNFFFPIPPMDEQKRIVLKIEELFNILRTLQ